MDRLDERNKRTLEAHNRGEATPPRRWVEWSVAITGLVFLAGVVVVSVQGEGRQGGSATIGIVGAVGFFLVMAFAVGRRGRSR